MAVKSVQVEAPPAKKLHPLKGYGAQFNTDLFLRAHGLTPQQRQELRETVANLRPGHSRIFVRRGLRPDTPQGRNAPEFVALMDTIELAQQAGANVNLTWWGQGPYANEERLRRLRWPNRTVRDWPQPDKKKWPDELTNPDHPQAITGPRVLMRRFAQIIAEARRRGFTCVTHATIQNEVNGAATDIAKQGDPGLSMRLYELLYRFLDAELKAIPDPADPSQPLRRSIAIVGGDLLDNAKSRLNSQKAWLRYMHRNMELEREGFPRVLDGYSIHVYWEPEGGGEGFPRKLEKRLQELTDTIGGFGSTLPIYVTEYGVRKLKARPRPGSLHGTKMERSPEAAFQHAWFNALAPQYGCAGAAKWVLYRAEGSKGWGEWGMIASPRERFERTPVYRVMRLFNHVADPGWLPAGLAHDPGAIASKFASADRSEESVVVLNAATRPQDVRVAGLRKNGRYFAAVWNADGEGGLSPHDPVTADGQGRATVDVPRRGVVALSTRPLRL
jgi:hypothetical protein